MIEDTSGYSTQELQQAVRRIVERIQHKLAVDYAAVALYDPENNEIRWRIAYGSLNDKYRGIAIRMGKGVAGEVLSTHRPVLIDSYPEDVLQDPLDYPILMVERLVSCYGAPIGAAGSVFGCLLLAHREQRVFTEDEQAAVAAEGTAIGVLYAPSYETYKLPLAVGPHSNIPAVLEAYIHKSQQAGKLRFEVLDQRVLQLKEQLQTEMTDWFQRLRQVLPAGPGEELAVSFSRESGQRLYIQISTSQRFEEAREELDWLIGRIGELNGHVELYNSPDGFRLGINLLTGMLLDGKPWTF
jgi:hypothetical protein